MARLQQWTIYVESREWVGPITVSVNGSPTTDFELTVTPLVGARPAGPWVAPVTADYAVPGGGSATGAGVVVGPGSSFPLDLGSYLVVARYTTTLEAPIVDVGILNVR